jgi:hypothetical protein
VSTARGGSLAIALPPALSLPIRATGTALGSLPLLVISTLALAAATAWDASPWALRPGGIALVALADLF